MIGTEKSFSLIDLIYLGKHRFDLFSLAINDQLSNYEYLTVIIITILATLACQLAIKFLGSVFSYMRNFRKNIVVSLFNIVIRCPLIKKRINQVEEKMSSEIKQTIKALRKNPTFKLPQTPMKEDTILAKMEQGSIASRAHFTNGGKLSGAVYSANDEHWEFINNCMKLHIEANPLFFTEFSFIG